MMLICFVFLGVGGGGDIIGITVEIEDNLGPIFFSMLHKYSCI